MRISRLWLQALITWGILLGCAEGPMDPVDAVGDVSNVEVEVPTPHTVPNHGPMNGYYEIEVSHGGRVMGEAEGLLIGGLRALEVTPVGTEGWRVMVQGAPSPGPVSVTVETASGPVDLGEIFTYDPPPHPALHRLVGFGASLTQGIQRGVPSKSGMLGSPAALIARQTGSYCPLPLVLTDLFPEVEATDIGPAPDCDVPDIAQHVASAASAIIPQLVDPVTEEFGFFHGRLDPAIDVHNVAVGGSMVGDALNGPNPENFGLLFMSHLTYEPYADLFDPVLESQLDRIEALGATIVISADLFGNDLILPLVTAGKLSENPPTPGEVIAQNIRGVIERLAKLDAIVFLANLPHPSLLPARVQKRLEYVRRATEGLEGEARREAEEAALREADVALAEIDAATQEANWVLADAASDHPNIHVVDLLGAVESVGPQGLEVGGSTLTLGRFGGLIGLDGVHFSDTGYALVANLFVEKISEVLGTDLEPLDLEAIHQNDADSPEALAADGLDPDCFEAL